MISMKLSSLSLLAILAVSSSVTIHNDIPRVDTTGTILNAHDGSVVLFGGLYHLYGTVYEFCQQNGTQCRAPCGYTPNTFALYTSPDLATWTLISKNIAPFQELDNNVVDYWMPTVFYNNRTEVYVMQFWSGKCGFKAPCADIATSASASGPFLLQPPLQLHGGIPSSQMGMFVDEATGRAYVKYNTGEPQHHVVEALTEDWLATTGEAAIVFWKPSFAWMEGGGMFQRTAASGAALYYYMTGTGT